MGGSTKQTTQQTQSNTIDPESKALLMANYQSAQDKANSLTPYSGQLTAGFDPTQTQAQGVLTGIGTNPLYGATANQAVGAAQGVLSNPLTASQLSTTNLTPYENPYQNDVINASISQNERARQVAQVADNQRATAGNAFGGSRQGVSDALTNEAYDRNNQSNIANLNAANFTQAQNAATGDIAAQNNMKQFNVGTQLTGANELANLNNNALGVATNQAGVLSAVGDAKQQQQQTELSNTYNAWLQGQQLTLDQQNLLNSALGMIPVQQTTNSNGTTETKSNPGLAGILGSLGTVAQSAALFL